MSMSGPGKSYRKGITLMDAVQKFDTEDKAEAWFRLATLALRRSLPLLRHAQRRRRCQPQASALSLP